MPVLVSRPYDNQKALNQTWINSGLDVDRPPYVVSVWTDGAIWDSAGSPAFRRGYEHEGSGQLGDPYSRKNLDQLRIGFLSRPSQNMTELIAFAAVQEL